VYVANTTFGSGTFSTAAVKWFDWLRTEWPKFDSQHWYTNSSSCHDCIQHSELSIFPILLSKWFWPSTWGKMVGSSSWPSLYVLCRRQTHLTFYPCSPFCHWAVCMRRMINTVLLLLSVLRKYFDIWRHFLDYNFSIKCLEHAKLAGDWFKCAVSRKGRAKPLLPQWAVRPVQSLSACTRVHFTFTFSKRNETVTLVGC
jgi:hypothetical protein